MCTWLNRRKRFTLGVGLGVVGGVKDDLGDSFPEIGRAHV